MTTQEINALSPGIYRVVSGPPHESFVAAIGWTPDKTLWMAHHNWFEPAIGDDAARILQCSVERVEPLQLPQPPSAFTPAELAYRDQLVLAAMQGDWASQSDSLGVFTPASSPSEIQNRAKAYFLFAEVVLRLLDDADFPPGTLIRMPGDHRVSFDAHAKVRLFGHESESVSYARWLILRRTRRGDVILSHDFGKTWS